MRAEFSIGQLVMIHDPELARSLGRQGEAGVVLQQRRGGARIAFLSDGGNAWVEGHRLYALADLPADSPLLDAVSRALQCLQAEEVEIESLQADRIGLNVRCLAFDVADLRSLRESLGEALLSWSVVPYGMASVSVVLEIGA